MVLYLYTIYTLKFQLNAIYTNNRTVVEKLTPESRVEFNLMVCPVVPASICEYFLLRVGLVCCYRLFSTSRGIYWIKEMNTNIVLPSNHTIPL